MDHKKEKEKEPKAASLMADGGNEARPPNPDPDGFTVLNSEHLLGPAGGRDRVVRYCYEHVADALDGAWIYRRM